MSERAGQAAARSFKGGRGGSRVTVEVKNITSASTSGTSGSTALAGAMRVPTMIGLPDRTLTVRDLLMPGTTNSGSIDYVKETVFTNNLADHNRAIAQWQAWCVENPDAGC